MFLGFFFCQRRISGPVSKMFYWSKPNNWSLLIDHWCIQLEQKISKSRMLEEVSMYCGKDVELPIFFDRRKQSNNVHEISEHFSWNRYVALKMFQLFLALCTWFVLNGFLLKGNTCICTAKSQCLPVEKLHKFVRQGSKCHILQEGFSWNVVATFINGKCFFVCNTTGVEIN